MDLIIYRDIGEIYNFVYNDNNFITILENIDSLKSRFEISFSIPKCKKLFSRLIQDSKKLPELKGIVFDLLSALINLYGIHPVVKCLLFLYYMTVYKFCNAEIYFEQSLRKYVRFFLDQNILNQIFKIECSCLFKFISDGLLKLNEAVNSSRNYLINYFYNYHFKREVLIKEYSETKSVFDLADYKNKCVVNICAGNACGIHLLESKITCIDIKKYMGMELLDTMDVCNFFECDIMDKHFESIVSAFNLWIAIHACRELSIRIINVFEKQANQFSKLYLVPCCCLSKHFYKKTLDSFIYDRIYGSYSKGKPKRHKLRAHCNHALHLELLCSLCESQKFKIKTLKNMKSLKGEEGNRNKLIIIYK